MISHSFKLNRSVVLSITIIILLHKFALSFEHSKRSIVASSQNLENAASPPDMLHANYDEYPMVVPKRAALLLDRIMVALHRVLEDEKNGSRKISDVYGTRKVQAPKEKIPEIRVDRPSPHDFVNGLTDDYDLYSEIPTDTNLRGLKSVNGDFDENGFQRRGHGADAIGLHKGKTHWRCYFNVVTCFK